nr:MAG TPA: ATP dependent DNA helicase [Caudoviricetes sp.]
MNSCVNTRSKEFKNLCSKYDVSSEKMELLIHQYWNDRNSDAKYPSDAYIEAHLGKSPYQESIDSVVKIWEKDYSKTRIFSSAKELNAAQNEAERFFPPKAIVSYTNNQGKYVLTIRKPVKNIKEAYRKAVENGSWDDDKKTDNNQDIEDIQMYISSNEDKSSNKTYFTFKDGTQVKAPFVVNTQQEAALNALDDFVKSNVNVITLSGYAGTGKTSIMQIFKEKMDKEGVPVTFTAATNKAANVLKTKVKDAQTLHSAFGIQAGVDYNSEYDLKHLVNFVKENDLLPGSVVVIDEASMIDDNIYKILNKIALEQNLKIIYLGDKAQLAPVNSTQISPIFRNKEGKVLELTKVERTGDNAILKEATDLRTKGVFSYVSSFNKEGKGVAFINPSENRKEIENIIKAFTAKIQNDPDYFRILAYRNNTISKYNDYVRKILGYDIKSNPNDYYPHKNEPIVGYNNWGYLKTKRGHAYRFINSESYKTIDTTAPITNIKLSVPNGKVYTITAKPVVVQKTDGTEDIFNFIDVRGNQDNRKAVTEIANVISYLWRKRKTVSFSEQSVILQEINKLQTALFVNDNIEENGRTIVQKVWDFGYAMTVHKSQGSTFKNVIIDDKDIQSARKNSEDIGYVDLGDSQEETVSKDQMDAILSSQEESIDSDITAAILADQGEEVSSMPTKAKETKEADINDTMDTVRQLEYVAVSRATDTATVITDKAKVEDSPLNHEATQVSKTNEHKSPVNPKDSTINPVIQRSENEITKQVVEHLKSIPGIKVFDKNAMEEYLKSHNQKYLQQYISKSSLPKGELSVLGSALMTKHGNSTSYGDVIQTANYEYTVNYKGAGEFDIIEYHQIDNNLKNEINDRERKRVPGAFDRLSSRDEFTESNYPISNYHVTNGETVGNNANLDKTESQRESNQASSNDGSSQHQEWSKIKRDSATGRITFVDGDGKTISTLEDWKNIETFTTPQGEVYGFVDKDGNIYLDETKISPEHPIHEYTHLWDRTVQKHNPQLWNRGIEFMRKTSMWEKIANDEHYGKRWKAMNLRESQLESLIASEVHARFVGERGAQLLDKLAKEKGQENIISKLKQWIKDMWKDLMATFGSWSKEDINALTLDDFNHMTVRDFVDGINLKEATDASYTEQQSNELKIVNGTISEPSQVMPSGDNQKPVLSPEEQRKAYAKDISHAIDNATFSVTLANRSKDDGEPIVQEYHSMVQYLMSQKAYIAHDYDAAAKIEQTKDDAEIVKLGVNVAGITSEEWAKLSRSVMKNGLKTMLEQNPSIMRKLLDSDTETFFMVQKRTGFGRGFANILDDIKQELSKKYKGKTWHDESDSSQIDLNSKAQMKLKVNLPGYSHYELSEEIGKQTPIEINALWQEAVLRNLDSQLTLYEDDLDEALMNKEEKAQVRSVLIQISAILKMKDENDYTDAKKREKLIKKEAALFREREIDNQIDNLINQNDESYKIDANFKNYFPPSKVQETAYNIMDAVSSIISAIQVSNDYTRKLFPNVKAVADNIDFTKLSRKEIIDTIGIKNITDFLYNVVDKTDCGNDDYKDSVRCMLLNNWDGMLRIGQTQLEFNEGIKIVEDYSTGTFDTVQDNNSSISNDSDDIQSNEDEDSLNEKYGDAQEAWQIDFRTQSVQRSMTTLVKSIIHDCYQLDKDGKKIYNPYLNTIALKVDASNASKQISYWTMGATNYEDMVSKLMKMSRKKKNLWLKQLLVKLNDTTGKYTMFQSQFFSTFMKSRAFYAVSTKVKGKVSSIQANNDLVLRSMMNVASAKYTIKQHPLFDSKGIRWDLVGNNDTVDSKTFNLYKTRKELFQIIIDHGAGEKRVSKERLSDNREWEHDNYVVFKDNRNSTPFSEDEFTRMSKMLSKVFQILGYDIDSDTIEESINDNSILDIAESLNGILLRFDNLSLETPERWKKYNPFDFHDSDSIVSYLRNMVRNAITTIEETSSNTVFNNGKTYQEYVNPSFLSILITKLGSDNQDIVRKTLIDNYSWSQWFCSGFEESTYDWSKRPLFRNPLLRTLYKQGGLDKGHGGVPFNHRINLSFNDHVYMRNMNCSEYAISVFTQYWASPDKNVAYYRIPMQSNKPTEDYIGTYCYRDLFYKNYIKDDLYDMFLMELSRIQTVRRRNLSKGDKGYIKNFDERGRKFCFFPFLNAYLDNDNLSDRNLLHNDKDSSVNNNAVYADLLQRKIEGMEDNKLSAEEEVALKKFTKEAMESYIDGMVDSDINKWRKNGILKAARDVNNIVHPYLKDSIENTFDKEKQPEKYAEKEKEIDAIIAEQLENFIWNDYCMSKNILMITLGDIAFYKDTEDMQKRLAQLHAPGIRARITATDFGDGTDGSAKRVSDGTYRTVILKDWDKYSSDIKDNLKEVLQRKVDNASENMKPQYKAIMENILHAYSEINVADAEGYTCPTAYRKKALMFGRWSEEDEEVYQALLKGKANMEQIRQAFQPLKPFMYSNQLRKNMGVDTAPIQTMACPFQAKNSEYLLVMADALLRNEKTSRPNLLKALTDIMEDSAFDGRERDANGNITKQGTYNGKGIDTIQFESAIKSSLQGAIDISKFAGDVEKGQQDAYDAIKKVIYKEGTNEYDTDNYVQEVPFENYCLQQEVPDHFIDHDQAHGSQIRAIIPSDLEEYYDPNKDHDDENNIVKYEWTEWQEVPSKYNPNKLEWKKVKVSLTASQFRREYEKTISDKIEDSISKLKRELKIDSGSLEETNMALSKILKREILGSPRYGLDMLTACSVDKTTGKFKVPLGDPIQCKRFEQLINSIIKNRINKQTIPGGPIVQVSNFGASKQLHIRFNDKNGNLMPLREEYKTKEHDGKSYEQYLKENQGGIAYFEVFAPIWSQELVEKFGDDKGNIDINIFRDVAPELLQLISYRIPTEDKYSMAPCKIVGFLPRMAGSTIMLPYELTTQDGSDFDIDKRYVMRKSLRIVENRKKVHEYLRNKFIKKFPEKTGVVDDIINDFFNADPDKYNETDLEVKRIYDALHEDRKEMMNMYITAMPSKDEFYNNRIINMSWAVLTNPTQVEKVLNPGGFDDQKKVGYMIEAYKNTSLSWNELKEVGNSEKGIDKLKKLSYKEKDIADFDTQLQFYKQNQAAGNLIGVFAVSKVSHAILGSDSIYIGLENILGKGKRRFNLGGNEFIDYILLDPEYDSNSNPIGKTLGSLVGASADAAKDPILNLMNINMTTCNALNAMLRIGIPFETAALFLSQNVISDILDETEKRNLSSYTNIMSVIDEKLTEMSKEDGFQSISNINDENLTMDELIEGVKRSTEETKYKVLLMYKRLNAVAEALRAPTLLTRFNSISSAVGPLAIDNLMVEHKVNKAADVKNSSLYFKDDKKREFNKIGALDILGKHPILSSFYKAYGIASKMLEQTPGGSLAFKSLLNEMNPVMQSTVMGDRKLLDKLCTFLITYKAINEGLVDESKLSYYINEFPKEVDKVKENKDYKDNAFIKAIIIDTDRTTNKPYLRCNLTGIDNITREKLSIGWLELYLKNPDLAKKFFDYSLFRGGLTFSPITFMALLPNQIKENLKAAKPDGSTVSYLDIFDTSYTAYLDYDKIIDQFVRNNCDSYKLVPTVMLTKTMSVNYNTKTLVISAQNDMAKVFGKAYIKTYSKNGPHIWKLSNNDGKNAIYHEIDALGNDGEYIEMSKNDITESLAAKEHNKEVKTKKSKEADISDSILYDTLNNSFCFDIGNDTQEAEDYNVNDSYENQEALAQEAADLLIHDKKGNMHSDKKVTDEENKDKRAILSKLTQVLKDKNIHLNEEAVKKEDKKLC